MKETRGKRTHLPEGVDAQVEILRGHHEERVPQADGDGREVLVGGVVLVGQHLPHEHDGHELEGLGERLWYDVGVVDGWGGCVGPSIRIGL